jgi:hypothetical protein
LNDAKMQIMQLMGQFMDPWVQEKLPWWRKVLVKSSDAISPSSL